MSGKNFSCNNTGKRKASDFYETPYSITLQLLEAETFDSGLSTLEPACGGGAIARVLNKHGFSDLTAYDKEQDFLLETRKFSQIITNPPFSLAFQFIQRAKLVAENKFVLLLPLSYLHGKHRLDAIYLDTAFPLARVYVFCRYPMLGDRLREDGKYRTGMMVYAWFVWDRQHKSNPHIFWLDNQKFVLSKKDITPNADG